MFEWYNWGNWWDRVPMQRGNTPSATTTKTSYTTTYDGKEFVVKDNISGESLKIDVENTTFEDAEKAAKLFIEEHNHVNKPKLEAPSYPDFDTGDKVVVTNPLCAYIENFAFFERHPNLKLYYQYHTMPKKNMVGTVKMKCINSYEEDSTNRYICVVADDRDRIWLIGEKGLEKVTNA